VKKITVLPFGSILTQLPLIVIGALYMLYLGLCAVNRSKEAPLTEISETKEHFVDLAPTENTIDYFSLAAFSKEKSDAHAETVSNSCCSISYFDVTFHIPEQGVFSRDPDYCLLTRPPPFIG